MFSQLPLGSIWPFTSMGSPFSLLLGAEFPPVSKGKIILSHTFDFGVFTAYSWRHEWTWSSLPPNLFTCWHQWEMTQQWPTQKGLVGWEHSPSMAQWALPCCQSTEEPSPRKGTSCWMQSLLIHHLHLLGPCLCILTSFTLCRAVLCRQSRTTWPQKQGFPNPPWK